MQKGIVYNVMKYALQDGPGIRTTVFLKGCPLKCWWCHNPESQDFDREVIFNEERCIGCGACITLNCHSCVRCGHCGTVCVTGAKEMVGKEMTVSEVMEDVEKDIVFYEESGGGATFSGGEPLMQLEFLLNLLISCKDKEISTAVDTTGYVTFEALKKIAPLTDIFLYDLKLMDEEKHRKFTGVSNVDILDNLKRLTAIHNGVYVRIPIIPTINNDEQSITDFAEFLKNLNYVKGIQLLPYHSIAKDKYKRLKRDYLLTEIQPPSDEEMRLIQNQFDMLGVHVKIGGGFYGG